MSIRVTRQDFCSSMTDPLAHQNFTLQPRGTERCTCSSCSVSAFGLCRQEILHEIGPVPSEYMRFESGTTPRNQNFDASPLQYDLCKIYEISWSEAIESHLNHTCEHNNGQQLIHTIKVTFSFLQHLLRLRNKSLQYYHAPDVGP